MKLTIVLVLLGFLSATDLQGQKKTPPTPEERASKLTEWMKTNLQLNDSQVAQVKDINLKYANKMQELYDNTTLTRRQKLQVLTDNDQAKDKELKNVLTEEQFKTYQAKKDEVKKQLKEKRKQEKNSG